MKLLLVFLWDYYQILPVLFCLGGCSWHLRWKPIRTRRTHAIRPSPSPAPRPRRGLVRNTWVSSGVSVAMWHVTSHVTNLIRKALIWDNSPISGFIEITSEESGERERRNDIRFITQDNCNEAMCIQAFASHFKHRQLPSHVCATMSSAVGGRGSRHRGSLNLGMLLVDGSHRLQSTSWPWLTNEVVFLFVVLFFLIFPSVFRGVITTNQLHIQLQLHCFSWYIEIQYCGK